MSRYTLRYDSTGTACTNGPQPGTVALRDALTQPFEVGKASGSGTEDGIYNCRPVRGGSTLSLHGEGRAWDAHVDPPSGDAGTRLAGWLVLHAADLGVQEVIWNRRIWSATHQSWRSYKGVDPHTGHVHVGLQWAAARGPLALTVEYVSSLLATPAPATQEIPAVKLNEPARDLVPIGSPVSGYVVVCDDGGLFPFGTIPFPVSSLVGHLNAPISKVLPTPSGNGFWILCKDGGIFTFGDAPGYGSVPGL